MKGVILLLSGLFLAVFSLSAQTDVDLQPTPIATFTAKPGSTASPKASANTLAASPKPTITAKASASPANSSSPKASGSAVNQGSSKPSTPAPSSRSTSVASASSPKPTAASSGQPSVPYEDPNLPKGFQFMRLNEQEIATIEKITVKYNDRIELDRAETAVIRAQVAKLLLAKQPDIDQIRTLIRKSMDYEGDVRIVEVERMLELKKAIGEDRWSELSRRVRNVRATFKDINPDVLQGRSLRLYTLYKNLMQP